MSGLAICVVDKEARIQDAAKVFFHKYSEVRSRSALLYLPSSHGVPFRCGLPLVACMMPYSCFVGRAQVVHLTVLAWDAQ